MNDSLLKIAQIKAQQAKEQEQVIDPLAELKSKIASNGGAEPQHYSWKLGTPDNIKPTEVIVNPYSNTPSAPAVAKPAVNTNAPVGSPSKPVKNVEPLIKANLPNATPEQYKNSMSVNVDGREVLIPTIDPNGNPLSEDEAYEQFEKSGEHLGMFNSPEDSDNHANALINSFRNGKI